MSVRRILSYVLKRFADRFIDVSGLVVAIIAVILTYTAGAQAINLFIEVPPAVQPLIPSELLSKLTELLDLCLESCFRTNGP